MASSTTSWRAVITVVPSIGFERTVPVTATEKQSRRSRYRVGDTFLAFRFRFVESNRSGIEQAPDAVYANAIRPGLPGHVSTVFEGVCREVVWRASQRDAFDTRYSRVGRWWDGGEEIDVVALDPNADSVLFGECRWTTTPVGRSLVTALERTSETVRWHSGERTESFVRFSKSGFADGLAEDLGPQWTLLDLADVEAALDGA